MQNEIIDEQDDGEICDELNEFEKPHWAIEYAQVRPAFYPLLNSLAHWWKKSFHRYLSRGQLVWKLLPLGKAFTVAMKISSGLLLAEYKLQLGVLVLYIHCRVLLEVPNRTGQRLCDN